MGVIDCTRAKMIKARRVLSCFGGSSAESDVALSVRPRREEEHRDQLGRGTSKKVKTEGKKMKAEDPKRNIKAYKPATTKAKGKNKGFEKISNDVETLSPKTLVVRKQDLMNLLEKKMGQLEKEKRKKFRNVADNDQVINAMYQQWVYAYMNDITALRVELTGMWFPISDIKKMTD